MKPGTIVVVSIALGALATNAHAQPTSRAFLSPFIGTTLNAPSSTTINTSPAGFGFAFGRLGKIAGNETEIAYYPELVADPLSNATRQRVFTFVENFVIGPTIGRYKPYGDIGFGDLLVNATFLGAVAGVDVEHVNNNYLAINVGGGLMAFFTNNIGVRGDLRYVRAYGFEGIFSEIDPEGHPSTGGPSFFDFWRLSVALAARF